MTEIGFLPTSAPLEATQKWSLSDAGGVVTWDTGFYSAISKELAIFARAYLDGARSIWSEHPAAFSQRLGLGSRLADQVPVQWDFDSAAFCRVDFLIENGTPVVLELNFGTSVGGSIDFEAWAATPGPPGLHTPNRLRMRWVARRAQALGARRVVIPLWPWLAHDDGNHYLASTRAHLKEFGFNTDLIALSDVATKVDPTRDVILRLFAIQDAYSHGFNPAQFGYGLGSPFTWLCGEFSTALSSKALLATVDLQARGLQSAARTSIVGPEAHGFNTISVDEAISRQEEIVLKPVDGLGGAGVTFGRESTTDAWAKICTEAVPGQWIAQQVVTPDSIETPHGPSSVVWGLYLVEGEPAGVLARFVPNVAGRDKVINGHSGAMLTATVLS